MSVENPFEDTQDPVKDEPRRKYACTVVNLMPIELNEDKPHMLPSSFRIPAAKEGKFGLLHVEEGIHYIPNPLIDEGQPNSSIRQITLADDMARSLVDDYNSAQVALGSNARPGLFWVPNRLNQKQITDQHPKLLKLNQDVQTNWYRNLCAMADADWQKNHNMLSVSDLQRMAARALGYKLDWVEMVQQETTACPMCKTSIDADAVICMSCKFVLKPDIYAKKKEQFANV